MNTTTLAFLLTSLAGFSTMIGTIPIFFHRFNKEKVITASLAFAAGVMITVSCTDLIPEALTLLHHTFRPTFSMLLMALFVVIGIIFSMLIDKYLPDGTNLKKGNQKLFRVGLISMLAIILHNVPEGIATFMATSSNTKLGISLAIAIALHNIPEGISISVPIFYATQSRLKALFYTLISGISEPIGALLAFLFLSPFINDTIMGLLFSLIAGIMVHIATYELLPTSLQYKKKSQTLLFLGIGIGFMLINHFLF